MFKQIGLISIIALQLGGCSVYKSNIDCKVGEGYKCRSMGEINSLIDAKDKRLPKEGGKNNITPPTTLKGQNLLPNFPGAVRVASLDPADEIYRKPEETMRVWIAPYRNASDEYVDGFYMHIVTKQASWHQHAAHQHAAHQHATHSHAAHNNVAHNNAVNNVDNGLRSRVDR